MAVTHCAKSFEMLNTESLFLVLHSAQFAKEQKQIFSENVF